MTKEFNIKDFGARACDALQTEKIQAALDGVSAGNGKSVSAEAIKIAQRLCDSSKNAKQ